MEQNISLLMGIIVGLIGVIILQTLFTWSLLDSLDKIKKKIEEVNKKLEGKK